ncbi:MAG TPA: tetratricopeptide repeat protein, partial [Vicinamibacteria bacterium]|nr:tetratricopeptide repeat protein [Vicinamibacteria bacterium]
QRAVVARLAAALAAGGWLAVAAVEAGSELFSSLVPAPAGTMLYRRAPTSAAPAGASAPVGIGLASESSRSSSHLSTGLLAASAAATPRPVAASRERGADAPSDPPGDLQRARALADQGDLDGARELCEAALSHDRLDPQAHLLLAAVCQERGEIPMAIEAVGRAIYLAPDSGLAHFLLGSLLVRQGAQKRARRSMEVVVRLLGQRARDEILAGGDGLTAGRLADTARAYLQAGT